MRRRKSDSRSLHRLGHGLAYPIIAAHDCQGGVLAADASFFTVTPCPFPTGVVEGIGFCVFHMSGEGGGAPSIRNSQLLPGVTSHVNTIQVLLPVGQLPRSFAYFMNIFWVFLRHFNGPLGKTMGKRLSLPTPKPWLKLTKCDLAFDVIAFLPTLRVVVRALPKCEEGSPLTEA